MPISHYVSKSKSSRASCQSLGMESSLEAAKSLDCTVSDLRMCLCDTEWSAKVAKCKFTRLRKGRIIMNV